MKLILKSVFLLSTLFFLNCSSNKEDTIEINGKILDTITKSILLVKPNQDIRFDTLIEIPVINGKFHYKSKIQNTEIVQLILGGSTDKGYFKSMPLFLENGKLDLTIYPEDDFDKNLVVGGRLNKMYSEFKTNEDSLFDKKPFEERLKWEQNYINKNPNMVSYYLFLEHILYFKEIIDLNIAIVNYKKLSESNPTHPYNDLAQNILNSIVNVKVGNPFIDISAPDLNGNKIKLSEKINGKIAILDLWATWCGPCIAKSRSMIPIYNEYKDKGFTIIGVAGEFKNTDKLVKFLEKEKWPWLNLIELDRKNSIWQKYGIDGAGGSVFLIDDKGVIIAIDPTPEEVKKELENRLK